MSKLHRLKTWVTISDAARHLSQSLSEPVTEADILQFGIQGRLVLSIYLPNGLDAQCWEDVDTADIRPNHLGLPDEWHDGEDLEGRCVVFFEGRFLRLCNPNGLGSLFYDDGSTLDLAMIGTEKAEIEQEFQRRFGGPALVNRGTGRAMLISQSGDLLLAREYLVPADADDPSIPDRFRKIGVMPKKADRLGEVGTFVVRPAALARFLSALEEPKKSEAGAQKGIGTRQRRTLLTLVAALCKKAGIDPASRGAAVEIAALTHAVGAPVSDDSIRPLLREIPDAMESRSR